MSQLPKTENLLHEVRRGVLYLTFNRPEARNAMSTALLQEIVDCFAAIREDRSIRAVVLRGAGGHFCAGGDIKDMANARAAKARAALYGRPVPNLDDVREVVPDVLRHRIVPGFEAEAEGRTADDLVAELIRRSREW